MADKRRARRESDPGLQPERTSLAWFRTLLGYGALMALAIKHSWHRAGLPFWLSIGVLAIVAVILWGYTRWHSCLLLLTFNRSFYSLGICHDRMSGEFASHSCPRPAT